MNIELVRATSNDDTTLRNLLQFYIYEFTRFMTTWHVNYAGRYTEDDLDNIWQKPELHTFIIRVDGALAGFALVEANAPISPETVVMEEFFVMAAFQGKGIAEQVAVRLFDMYPGQWKVFELDKNVRAQHFWRRVIGRYIDNQYREEPSPDGRGIVQYFDNRHKRL